MAANRTGLSRLPQSPSEFADLIELSIIAQPRSPHSFNRILESLPDYIYTDEITIGLALGEMRRRSLLLLDKYPFDVTDARVLPTVSSSAYRFLLGTSFQACFNNSYSKSDDSISKRFEDLSEFCLSTFFGEQTQTVNFGFPSLIGRPPSFPEAVEWLAERMGINSGNAYRSPRRQDGGVDLVIWRTFADKKPGFPIVLVQSTIQQDLLSKSRDIDLRLWSGWLSMDVDPLMGLTSPHVIANTEVWNEITRNCLLFDRIRLTQLSPSVFEPEPIDNEIFNFVLTEISNLT